MLSLVDLQSQSYVLALIGQVFTSYDYIKALRVNRYTGIMQLYYF